MTWKGQLNLGLVSIPVGMATAVREKDVKFRQFTEDLHPVGRQEFDKETGEILTRSDIKKGYEIDGKVDTVLSRGTVLVENDEYVGRKGHGQFIKRGLSQYLV